MCTDFYIARKDFRILEHSVCSCSCRCMSMGADDPPPPILEYEKQTKENKRSSPTKLEHIARPFSITRHIFIDFWVINIFCTLPLGISWTRY